MSTGRVWSGLVVALVGLGGCASAEPEADVSWREPARYAYTLESSCGERALIGVFRISVEGGRVVDAEGLDKSAERTVESAAAGVVPTLGELVEELNVARRERIAGGDELEIAAERADGSLRRWTPIWVVTADGQVFVRTWHRRETGWYGDAVRSRRARIRAGGLEADVVVNDVGAEGRAAVDDAYRAKYGRYGNGSVGPMVAEAAAVSTLRLDPNRGV
jgi:hypothetical protein